ncbi:MAG: DNA polymerase domain-containing protein, partial [archaeon]
LEKKGSAGGAKKRYALLNRNGRLLLRGLEAIRGDWSQLAKKVQRKVLDLILADGDANRALTYIHEMISKVRNRKIALADLIIEVRLTRALSSYTTRGPHVAAAELAAAKGENVGRGYKVKFIVKTGAGKIISERVALPENTKPEDFDIDYYVDHQVIRPVVKIFELFNILEEKLKGGQTTLG